MSGETDSGNDLQRQNDELRKTVELLTIEREALRGVVGILEERDVQRARLVKDTRTEFVELERRFRESMAATSEKIAEAVAAGLDAARESFILAAVEAVRRDRHALRPVRAPGNSNENPFVIPNEGEATS